MNYKMLEYYRIDFSEGIEVNRTDKCMFCHYWYFLHKHFSHGTFLCDGCYNIMQKSINSKNIAVAHI